MKNTFFVSCPIDTYSGYGARSRDFVKALIQLKDKEWDIKIMPQKWGNTPWKALSKDNPLRQRFIQGSSLPKQPDIWIQITVPNEFQPVGNFNIGISAGIETNIYPADFIEGSNNASWDIKTDGTLWVWGQDYHGKLGLNQQGPTIKYSTPTQIPGTNWNIDNIHSNTAGYNAWAMQS